MKLKTLAKKLLIPAALLLLVGCDENQGGAIYFSGATFDISDFSFPSYPDISLPEMYTVSYELNGGTYIDNPVNAYNGIEYLVNLEYPTKEGVMFDGWYMDAEFTTRLEDADPNTTGDITLYAKWIEVPGFTVEGYNKGTIITSYTGESLDVVVPERITKIDSYVFMGRDDLTSISLPSTLIEIGNSAFKGCSISSITLPESLEVLGDSAFANCANLKSIVLPKWCDEIGDFAFSGCWALEEVTLGDYLGVISDYMFSNCLSLKTINFGTKGYLWKAADNAFYNCTNLEEVTFPSGFRTLTFYTFRDCRNLKKVVLPASMGYVGEYVFSGCSALPKIWIPSNIIYMGSYCFEYCSNLTIYCECLENETHGYQSNWNASRPVVWGSANINQ